ncbi:hypothetical protein CARUB_v10025030mg [Capsella rubella]|uniref:Alkyl transferase n=1 Tax=Capsella rubella TaxID=81985 RepID=R0HXI1_9BRAS|nr:hypothetical protein CARUB_v10025030mg [Capsella rubella]
MLSDLFSSLSSIFFLFLIPCLFITSYICFPLFLPKLLGLLIKIIAARDDDDNKKLDEGTNVVREEELQRELMPRHVAVIVDGNRRWAKRAGLFTLQGHEAGAKRLTQFAEHCFDLVIQTVSAFLFSTENWGRNKVEVKCLMSLLEHYIKSQIQYFQSQVINEIEEATKGYKNKHLILAIDYSGRFDLTLACKSIVKKSEEGLIREEDVDETLIERELMTNTIDFPSPDFLIRTSGEQRISNFFLWQLCLH